ncbi:hypothetical protein SVAN01_03652 [Stagonosporopsis vannaccii]|nr:hypothetical protein SVAN01_03652 [Stagonosporopsis vannaccii]
MGGCVQTARVRVRVRVWVRWAAGVEGEVEGEGEGERAAERRVQAGGGQALGTKRTSLRASVPPPPCSSRPFASDPPQPRHQTRTPAASQQGLHARTLPRAGRTRSPARAPFAAAPATPALATAAASCGLRAAGCGAALSGADRPGWAVAGCRWLGLLRTNSGPSTGIGPPRSACSRRQTSDQRLLTSGH